MNSMNMICFSDNSLRSQGGVRWRVAATIAQIVLGFLILSGTAQADDRTALLGTWHKVQKLQKVTFTADMTFAGNGTFYGHIDREGRRFWNFAGKWTLTGKALHYDYTKSDLAGIPVGTKDDDVVIKITPTTLKLKTDMGEEVWVRRASIK